MKKNAFLKLPVPDPYVQVGDAWSWRTKAALRRLARQAKEEWDAGKIVEPNTMLDGLIDLMNRTRIGIDEAWIFCAQTIAEDIYNDFKAGLENEHATESELAHAS